MPCSIVNSGCPLPTTWAFNRTVRVSKVCLPWPLLGLTQRLTVFLMAASQKPGFICLHPTVNLLSARWQKDSVRIPCVKKINHWFSKSGAPPSPIAASASPGKLYKIQILGPHLRPADQESVFTSPADGSDPC